MRINSAMDLHELLTIIMDTARELLSTEASSLLLFDSEKKELIFDIARGQRGSLLARRTIPLGSGIAGTCALERQAIVVNDAENDSRVLREIDESIGFKTRNLLAVPMLTMGNLVGVLEVVNTTDNRQLDAGDTRLLTYLSNMAALAIYNRKLYVDLQNRMEELDCVFRIAQSIHVEDDLDIILNEILLAIAEVLEVERVSIVLASAGGKDYRIVKNRGFEVSDGERLIGTASKVIPMVLQSGEGMLIRDAQKELGLAAADRYRTGSFICVPIIKDGESVGALSVADKTDDQVFDEFELKVLSTVAGQLADALSRTLARERDRQIRDYKKDLETAALIQQNSLPKIPSLVAGVQVATRYEACKEVGGDFYDLLYHSDQRISVVMADVAGKGVPAALFMEYSKTLLSGQIPRHLDPVSTLTTINREIYAQSRMGLFVTVMLIQLEREMNRIRLASAGHNHQILVRVQSNRIESLSAKGPPLGIFKGSEYLEGMFPYDPGDLLILYTDGITEAHNAAFQDFGEERLFELVLREKDRAPTQIIDTIFAAVADFRSGEEAADDATIMVLRL